MSDEVFRQEALDHYRQGDRLEHAPLRLSARWLTWSYLSAAVTVVAGLLYLALARVNEYAPGPAVIRARGAMDLTAQAGGTVASIEVVPGQRVMQAQLLVRLDSTAEAAELQRVRQQLDVQLVKYLVDPKDPGPKQMLGTLTAQKQLAAAKLAQREIRASFDGIVSAVRIRPGEHLVPGQTAVVLVRPESGFRVIAAVPAQYRPLIRRGGPMRLELSGYPYAYQGLVLDTLESQAIGPGELKRFLGQELGDTVNVSGPVVLVQAQLPSLHFMAEGRTYPYFDGMEAWAQARVRRAPMLVILAPWLRYPYERLFRGD